MSLLLRLLPIVLLVLLALVIFIRLLAPDGKDAKKPPDIMSGQMMPPTP